MLYLKQRNIHISKGIIIFDPFRVHLAEKFPKSGNKAPNLLCEKSQQVNAYVHADFKTM